MSVYLEQNLLYNGMLSNLFVLRGIPLFYFTIKTDIIRYYLLTNSTPLKVLNKKYKYAVIEHSGEGIEHGRHLRKAKLFVWIEHSGIR